MKIAVNKPAKIIIIGLNENIDLNEKEAGIIRELYNLKMENVAVINLHRLNNYRSFNDLFQRFKDLMEDAEVFKILYSEIEDDVRNLPTSIDWRNKKDTVYTGEKLEFSEIVIRTYWDWKLNKIISPSSL